MSQMEAITESLEFRSERGCESNVSSVPIDPVSTGVADKTTGAGLARISTSRAIRVHFGGAQWWWGPTKEFDVELNVRIFLWQGKEEIDHEALSYGES